MTTEEFNKKQSSISDKELIEHAEKQISDLARSYGKSHTMCIPPMVTDTDMILSELLKRYKDKIEAIRWRDPVNEPPKINVSVFVKYDTATGKLKYGVGRYFPLGIGNDWTVEGSTSRKIIGWRPIEEDSL